MTWVHWGNPFVLISKTSCLIGYSLFHFHLFFRVIVWKKAGKEIYSHCRSVERADARAVFTGMSRVIRIRFGFAFLRFLFCTETLATFSRPIRSKANQSLYRSVNSGKPKTGRSKFINSMRSISDIR